MKEEKIIQKTKQFQDLKQKYTEVQKYLESSEDRIDKVEKFKENLSRLKEKDRLLQIGIVGRVKAGKSSLINALLFDGSDVLPKAATPMTAALTEISYGKELKAEVDFFTQEEVDKMKVEHQEYIKQFQEEVKKSIQEQKKMYRQKQLNQNPLGNPQNPTANELNKMKERAERKAKQELKKYTKLNAIYDQVERMNASGLQNIPTQETLDNISLENLQAGLGDYVGSSGKYMPFTKSVHIKIPQEDLKDIKLVDTPGLNDPVQSREERTKELLKLCDVIFVVSPASQFLSKEDLDLMDRISKKEGVQEIFLTASKVDTELFGSEKSNDLSQTLANITSILGKHATNILSKHKSDYPEVGDIFNKIIEEAQNNTLHSSGVAQTLKSLIDKPNTWDSNAQTVWRNLVQYYPNYFSQSNKQLSIGSLDLLANIKHLHQNIQNVKSRKEAILNKKIDAFLNAQEKSLEEHLKKLKEDFENHIEEIKSTDINEIKEKKKKTLEVMENIEEGIFKHESLINKLIRIELPNLKKPVHKLFDEIKSANDNSIGEETEYYEVRKSGTWSWVKRGFGAGGYEEKSRHYSTVQANAIRGGLEDFRHQIRDSIIKDFDVITEAWRKDVYKSLVAEIREIIGDENISINPLKIVLRKIVSQANPPEINNLKAIPDELKKTGTLIKSEAEKFIETAENYIHEVKESAINAIDDGIKKMDEELKNYDVAKKFTKDYKEKIEQLEQNINNKETSIKKYEDIIQEIEKIINL